MLYCKKCHSRVVVSVKNSNAPVKVIPALHNGNLEPDSIELVVPQNLKVERNFFCLGCEKEIEEEMILVRCRDCGNHREISRTFTDEKRMNYICCGNCADRLEADEITMISLDTIWDSFFKD